MNRPESIIEMWIRNTSSNGGVERYDDLHIDQIDATWKPRSTWSRGAFESFRLALPLRDRFATGMSIVLGFHLIDGERPIGLNFKSPAEFERNLSSTPPSLYLMHKGAEFWTQTVDPDIRDLDVRQLDPTLIGPFSNVACHFMEFKRISTSEYTRSVFIHS